MKKRFITILMSIFLTTGAAAQGKEHIWTLEDCMEYAVRNSSKTKKQEYTNQNYRQDYISAIGNLTPSLQGNVGADWRSGRSIDTRTNGYTTSSNFSNNYYLSASLPLFNGLSYINQIRSAKITRLRGVEELQKVKDDISLKTMEAYIDVVYYSEALKIAQDQLEASLKNLYYTQKQEELGLMGRPDIAQFEAEVANFEYTVIRQQNLLNASLLNLKDRMNYPFEEELNIDPNIRSQSGIFTENAADIFLDAKNFLPQARIAEYLRKESEFSLAITRGRYYPSLSASGSVSTNYYKAFKSQEPTISFGKQLDGQVGKGVGFNLSIPIFNGLKQRTQVNRARNNLRIAEETYDESMRELQREIEQAVMDVEGYTKEYAQAIKKVTATEQAHQANQRKFEEGLISALELQNSTNQLLQAKVDRLNVRLQYHIKCRLLDYYKGEPLIGL